MSPVTVDSNGWQAADLGAIVAAFGHALHASGVPVTPERSTRFGTAIALAEPRTTTDLYWLGRITLLTGRDQIDTYDAVFSRIFRGVVSLGDAGQPDAQASPANTAPGGDVDERGAGATGESTSRPRATGATPSKPSDDDSAGDDVSVLAAMSVDERLGDREFSSCTEEELQLLAKLVAELPLIPPMRKGRRRQVKHSGERFDVRRTLRRAHRTAGDPVRLIRRDRKERPRRIVLISDISGSMEPYARVYLHLLRGAVQALGAEAFVFATRLTRITRMLAEHQPDVAYRNASAAAPDWSGGTRIGEALMTFIDEYGRRGMARGAVIVIVSDGWEVADPALVGVAMERLQRLAHHIIWVNPRKAASDYAPLVGGMAAALPFVDTFISGHSYRALQDVMDAVRHAGDSSLSFNPQIRRVAS
jgi:uncharacterized protein